jgi:hypothetical protein
VTLIYSPKHKEPKEEHGVCQRSLGGGGNAVEGVIERDSRIIGIIMFSQDETNLKLMHVIDMPNLT